MLTTTRLQVYREMLRGGLVPLFHHDDPDVAVSIVRAVAASGCPVVEFTNRGVAAHEVFAAIQTARRRERLDLLIGAGSIVDTATAGLYLNLGAAFVVGPTLEPEVARLCNRRKVAYLPGCGTATEIGRAEELGCEIVKLFPGGAAGGPAFVKAFLGPSPWTRIMPTGSVEPTHDSLDAWFRAGVACVAMGSKLITRELIEQRDWAGLTARVGHTLQLIAELRDIPEEVV
jgi:2-dehydro-3-deoxyphosphogluconate aldolase / (4S)-4-hydroxy-2-oxoglutarate aldolase